VSGRCHHPGSYGCSNIVDLGLAGIDPAGFIEVDEGFRRLYVDEELVPADNPFWIFQKEFEDFVVACHRRFQQWVRSGIMRGILEALAEELHMKGQLDVREAFIDGSFAPAKKGDRKLARRNVAREQRSWPWQTVMAFP
jgi:hypothetical protein